MTKAQPISRELQQFFTAPQGEVDMGAYYRNPLWGPGVRLMSNLPFAGKALLICLMFLVPLVWVSWAFYSTQSDAIAFSEKELLGVQYTREVFPVIAQAQNLRRDAAVEAARAGEQGRGFAVVASEVRSLAGRSAEAAKEIKSLIGASVDRVEQGTLLVDKAGETMTEVVASIRRVTDFMGEISAASNEQSLGVARVGEAVTQMDQATQQNAALVEEMAAAASSLKTQAEELVQTVAVFDLGSGGIT